MSHEQSNNSSEDSDNNERTVRRHEACLQRMGLSSPTDHFSSESEDEDLNANRTYLPPIPTDNTNNMRVQNELLNTNNTTDPFRRAAIWADDVSLLTNEALNTFRPQQNMATGIEIMMHNMFPSYHNNSSGTVPATNASDEIARFRENCRAFVFRNKQLDSTSVHKCPKVKCLNLKSIDTEFRVISESKINKVIESEINESESENSLWPPSHLCKKIYGNFDSESECFSDNNPEIQKSSTSIWHEKFKNRKGDFIKWVHTPMEKLLKIKGFPTKLNSFPKRTKTKAELAQRLQMGLDSRNIEYFNNEVFQRFWDSTTLECRFNNFYDTAATAGANVCFVLASINSQILTPAQTQALEANHVTNAQSHRFQEQSNTDFRHSNAETTNFSGFQPPVNVNGTNNQNDEPQLEFPLLGLGFHGLSDTSISDEIPVANRVRSLSPESRNFYEDIGIIPDGRGTQNLFTLDHPDIPRGHASSILPLSFNNERRNLGVLGLNSAHGSFRDSSTSDDTDGRS